MSGRKVTVALTIYAALFWAAGEGYVRWSNQYVALERVSVKHYRCPHPKLHHTFIPNGKGVLKHKEYTTRYTINSFGFRDREVTLDKPEGVYRILMLGDSFTEGVGVDIEDSFPKQLEALLQNSGLRQKYEVINGGCSSYSPLLEYLLLKEKGLQLHPDRVILSFDMMDTLDDLIRTRYALFDPAGHPVAVVPYQKKDLLFSFLERHSPFFVYLRWKYGGYLRRHVRGFKPTQPGVNQELFAEEGWTLSQKYLLLIRDVLKEQHISFAIVIYPWGHQVNGSEWKEGGRHWGFESGKVYPTSVFPLMEEFGRKNGIPVISLLEAFQKSEVHPLYYEEDPHFNQAGHRLAAETIYQQLRRRKLLPE